MKIISVTCFSKTPFGFTKLSQEMTHLRFGCRHDVGYRELASRDVSSTRQLGRAMPPLCPPRSPATRCTQKLLRTGLVLEQEQKRYRRSSRAARKSDQQWRSLEHPPTSSGRSWRCTASSPAGTRAATRRRARGSAACSASARWWSWRAPSGGWWRSPTPRRWRTRPTRSCPRAPPAWPWPRRRATGSAPAGP